MSVHTESPKRKRRLKKVAEILDSEEIKPDLRIIDGLCYVVPYTFTLRTYAKKRWFDQKILEVLSREFQAYPTSYYEESLASGRITVNDNIVPSDYLLKDHDFIAHKIHRHEPPVLAHSIRVIEENNEVIVVEKPASIPVHTTGKYRHNTLLKTLERKHSMKLYTCHRLDRLTSGIIVILKNPEKAKQFAALFRDQQVSKTYLALCSGMLPDEKFSCSEPILQVSHKLGINKVDREGGKPAHTDFTRLHYDDKTNRSLVLCEPRTGKMHQIRVHLAHCGFPIPNDPIYSKENWAKKSTEEFSKELTEALFKTDNVAHLINKQAEKNSHCLPLKDDKTLSGCEEKERISVPEEDEPATAIEKPNELNSSINMNPQPSQMSGDGIKTASTISVAPNGDFLLDGVVHKRIPQLSFESGCPECQWTRLVPRREDMLIFLHAIRYEMDGNVFVSGLPEWCPKEWIPSEYHKLLHIVDEK